MAESYPEQEFKERSHLEKRLSWLSLLVGAASSLLGTMVIIGWHTHQPGLIQIHPQFVPMQYNTGISFLLSGVGLIACASGIRIIGRVQAALVLLLSGLTLLQYALNTNIGLDQLLMKHYITIETSHPGRMAPNTALCFFLFAIGLFFALDTTKNFVVGIISALIVGMGFVAFSGYGLGLEMAYGWGDLTKMAVHTSLGFIVIGSGLTLLALKSAKGGDNNWWPVAVAITIAIFTISLAQAIHAREKEVFALLNKEGIHFDVLVLAYGAVLSVAVYVALRLVQKLHKRNVELNDIAQRMEELSITDHLTRLYNRLKIDDSIKNEIQRSRRFGHELAIVLLDIDYFKRINDTFGHPVGDQVLIVIAQILMERKREVDMIGRWGGEEFLILCPETKLEGAISLAETLRKNIENEIFEEVGGVTCSFGVATLREGDSITTLVKRADDALYKAKKNGRNQVASQAASKPEAAN